MKQFDLYLGHDIPGGGVVTDENLLDFLRYETLLECFTLIEARGAWNGTMEDTTILRIIAPAPFIHNVRQVARSYKSAFNQEAVLLTVTDIESETI
jgi:hypothetical protein